MTSNQQTSNFKALALGEETLRNQAPSIFAAGPMAGVSSRYTFVPTARIVDGLREHDWLPVDVEEQRIRKEARRGFQKHMIRFRRAEQMATLDEWNVELVLLNSHGGELSRIGVVNQKPFSDPVRFTLELILRRNQDLLRNRIQPLKVWDFSLNYETPAH